MNQIAKLLPPANVVVDLEASGQPGRRQFARSRRLIGAERYAGDRETIVSREDARAAADAAAYVQHRGTGREPIEAAPADHLVNEVDFRLQEVLAARRHAVMAQMDVLAPVKLQYPVSRPLIVGIGDGACGSIPPRRRRVQGYSNYRQSK